MFLDWRVVDRQPTSMAIPTGTPDGMIKKPTRDYCRGAGRGYRQPAVGMAGAQRRAIGYVRQTTDLLGSTSRACRFNPLAQTARQFSILINRCFASCQDAGYLQEIFGVLVSASPTSARNSVPTVLPFSGLVMASNAQQLHRGGKD